MRTWLKAALIASLMEALLIAPLLLWPLKPGVEEPWPVKVLEWYHYISFMLAYAAGLPPVRRILGDQFQIWSCLFIFQVALTTPIIFLFLPKRTREKSK
jgi:hypothetical protein